jgi:hypothetical protein
MFFFGTTGCAEEAEEDKKIGVLFIGAGMQEGYQEPHREYWLKWLYGNDVPAYYGYEPDLTEAFNVKDELAEVLPDYKLVFRHGWEAQMENVDKDGNDREIVDSTETAIRELIEDEQVDRIIVASGRSHFSNQRLLGECWEDHQGDGVSILPGSTYKECVHDVSNGIGPADQGTLDERLASEPWGEHRAVFPHVMDMVRALSPKMNVTFASAFGKYENFNEAVVQLFTVTQGKFHIPGSSVIKVIVATEGPADGFLDEGACDVYPLESEALATGATKSIKELLASSWQGLYDLGHGETARAQPTEDGNHDPPGAQAPNGEIMSTGEAIDMAINGSYVSGVGQKWDGASGTNHIVVLPVTWIHESWETIETLREQTLGNHVESEAIPERWVRQIDDSDGSPYDEDDYDAEYCTEKAMDLTGWASIPNGFVDPVKKGSAGDPTTVIISGTILSAGNSATKRNVGLAMTQSIVDALDGNDTAGRLDMGCEAD